MSTREHSGERDDEALTRLAFSWKQVSTEGGAFDVVDELEQMKTMRDSIYTEVLPFMGKVRGYKDF
jgi:hypothetical protein